MAASHAHALVGGTVLGRYAIAGELGSRGLSTYVARAKRDDGATELVVVERLGSSDDTERATTVVNNGKRLTTLAHPNLVRVRELDVIAGEIVLVSDLVDAETYDAVVAATSEMQKPMPLVLHLRILVDVLGGLSSLHLLRDARNAPLGLVHGEVCPANIILAVDGNAKLAHLCRVPGVRGTQEARGYLAPEVRLEDKAVDCRADVYSCGVMLWEVLAGRRLFPEEHDAKILPRQLADKNQTAPTPRGEPWAAPLADVAARALAADPKARYPTAADMAAELRKVAGAKLALKSTLALLVRSASGERIAARKGQLTGGAEPPPIRKPMNTPAREIPPEVLARALVVDSEEAPPAEPRPRMKSDLEPTEKVANPRGMEALFQRAVIEADARKPPPAPDSPKPPPAKPPLVKPPPLPVKAIVGPKPEPAEENTRIVDVVALPLPEVALPPPEREALPAKTPEEVRIPLSEAPMEAEIKIELAVARPAPPGAPVSALRDQPTQERHDADFSAPLPRGQERRRAVTAGAVVLVAILLLIVGVRMATRRAATEEVLAPTRTDEPGRRRAASRPEEPRQPAPEPVPVPTPIPEPVPVATAVASSDAPVTARDLSTVRPPTATPVPAIPAAQPVPQPQPRPTPRTKATYDPLGI